MPEHAKQTNKLHRIMCHFGHEIHSQKPGSNSKIYYATKDRRIEQRIKETEKKFFGKNVVKSEYDLNSNVRIKYYATGFHRWIIFEFKERDQQYNQTLSKTEIVSNKKYGAKYNCVSAVAELLSWFHPDCFEEGSMIRNPFELDKIIKSKIIPSLKANKLFDNVGNPATPPRRSPKKPTKLRKAQQQKGRSPKTSSSFQSRANKFCLIELRRVTTAMWFHKNQTRSASSPFDSRFCSASNTIRANCS